MLPNARGFSWSRVFAMVASLAVFPAAAWAAVGHGATGTGSRSDHADPAIRRAQSLLDIAIPVPIDVVDVGTLPPSLAGMVKGSCAYIRNGVARIYVTSSCPVYRAAQESLFDAMKLAAILLHELAHIETADEMRAYKLEAAAFRGLVRRGPTHFMSRGLAYANELDRRAAASEARRGLTAMARGSEQKVETGLLVR
jgi:hypothetical protein